MVFCVTPSFGKWLAHYLEAEEQSLKQLLDILLQVKKGYSSSHWSHVISISVASSITQKIVRGLFQGHFFVLPFDAGNGIKRQKRKDDIVFPLISVVCHS